MTALHTSSVSGEKPERPYKSRYDSVVRLKNLYDESAVDQDAMMGMYGICMAAEKVMSDAELYCVSATHFYSHDRKKSLDSLAIELGCSIKTVQSFIESGKKLLRAELKSTDSPFVQHPVLRVRVYPLKDGEASALPRVPLEEGGNTVNISLGRMASTLFEAETHFAVCAYYLSGPNDRMTASQIAEALNLSVSGVRQKLHEARNVLEQSSKYQLQSNIYMQHPMFTRTDVHFSQRRLQPHRDDRHLALGSVSVQLIFEKASTLELRYLIPLMRTRFFDAAHKQPLEVIASDMRLAVSAVEEYLVQGREQLVALLRAENPTLATHPILRSHSRYQTEADIRRDFRSIDMSGTGRFLAEDQTRLKWAEVLLNRQPYHLVAWGLSQPKRGLKQAFDGHPDVSKWVTYSSLVQILQKSKKLCDAAEEIELKVTGRDPMCYVHEEGASGLPHNRDFH